MSDWGDRSVVAGGLRELAVAQLGGRSRKDSRKPRETRLSGRSPLTHLHRHSWERFELRDDDGLIYYVGYHCECGETGYELRLETA